MTGFVFQDSSGTSINTMKARMNRSKTAHGLVLFLLAAMATAVVHADGPRDNNPDTVRRVPKLGVEVSADDRAELQRGLLILRNTMGAIRAQKKPASNNLLTDIEIFVRAISDALTYQEFFSPRDVDKAKELLNTATDRAEQLRKGIHPWTTQKGLMVRGYRSRLDDTVQPYGLVIPDSYTFEGSKPYRLDIWFHGRGETLSEVNFLDGRMKQVGRYAPKDTFVLHPYGRYSNAFKFAGEIDVLEALADVQRRYRIDSDRISVRGFSMGGAACWQFACLYSDRWFAANPGAGFSETPEFLKFFQKESLNPTWWERRLWTMYDCPGHAINLYHCPTVAYSGEDDIQKQAADIMEAACKDVGIDLVHIIGAKTKHTIDAASMVKIEQRMDALAIPGRTAVPRQIHFATHTLKYNRMKWITIDALEEHWKQARVVANLRSPLGVVINTTNITQLTVSMPPGRSPFDILRPVGIAIDKQQLRGPRSKSDRSFSVTLTKTAAGWKVGAESATGLRKRHNLQGPIDDAFMDSFLFVKPTGTSPNKALTDWAAAELEHAQVHWRRQFRGYARVKDDKHITDDDIARHNLILWGDAQSNAVLARIADKLPIRWNGREIQVGDVKHDSKTHGLIMIYPNPLNPERY
ncbi:MAG: hypothetical protein O3A00_04355, partial [Planctomycetota bacterium]|nr:hypothetical protein [Planctomycetota bacterium]